jgi:hypothetical protein
MLPQSPAPDDHRRVRAMDESFLKEHAARCRSLADKADEFTKRRLLDLASRYENRLRGRASRASRIIKLPYDLPDFGFRASLERGIRRPQWELKATVK